MTGYDLAEWEGFERVHGSILIHERVDAAQAMLSSVTAKVNHAKGDLTPSAFLPQWDAQPERRDQTPDELVEVLRQYARKGRTSSPT